VSEVQVEENVEQPHGHSAQVRPHVTRQGLIVRRVSVLSERGGRSKPRHTYLSLGRDPDVESRSDFGNALAEDPSESHALTRQSNGHSSPSHGSNRERQQLWPFSCEGLWAGKFPLQLPLKTQIRVNFVVAYCSNSLINVNKVIAKVKALGVTVGNIDIYSKCGRTPDVQPAAAVVHHLPNVGGTITLMHITWKTFLAEKTLPLTM